MRTKKQTPADLTNPPGHTALKYRAGTHSQFKADMVELISYKPALKNLTIREDDDLAIALLDSWATIADVLTFYQERIINEGYLRTATERRSILELARAIGYELRPGVAANVALAFMVEQIADKHQQSCVEQGTQIMSIPGHGEQMQTFEIVEQLVANAALNDLRPLQFVPTKIEIGCTELYLKGVESNLAPGDALLFVGSERLGDAASKQWDFRFIHAVTEYPDKNYTHIIWRKGLSQVSTDLEQSTGAVKNPSVFVLRKQASLFGYNAPDWKTMPDLIKNAYDDSVVNKGPQEYKGRLLDWPGFDKIVDNAAVHFDAVYSEILPESWVVFAGQWIEENQRRTYHVTPCKVNKVEVDTQSDFTITAKTTKIELDIADNAERQLYGFIRRDTVVFCFSELLEITNKPLTGSMSKNEIVLEQKIPELKSGQKIIVQGKQTNHNLKQDEIKHTPSTKSENNTLCSFLNKKTQTKIVLRIESNNGRAHTNIPFLDNNKQPQSSRNALGTNCWVCQDWFGDNIAQLQNPTKKTDTLWRILDPQPIVDGSGYLHWRVILSSVTSNETYVGYVIDKPEHTLAIPTDNEATVISEVATIKYLSDDKETGNTKITLENPGLSNNYDLTTAHIFANVALATHGETIQETLGSGDSSEINQQFCLKKPPLTYVSATTPRGAISTLRVYVNDVQWQEAPTLCGLGPKDTCYIVRINDNGETWVRFGDGTTGARLPSGIENITTSYRSGLGLDGAVTANKLTLLTKKPFGIRSVTNPIAASGAEAPEKLENARINTPASVLTLDRIVSLKDYENFAQNFLGIAKAYALAEWREKDHIVRLIVAPIDAKPLAVTSTLYKNLQRAIEKVRAYGRTVCIESFAPVYFNLEGTVHIDAGYTPEKVRANIEAVLLEAFSFEHRTFKQTVMRGDITTTILTVEGVVYVNVTKLYLSGLNHIVKLKNYILPDNVVLMINPKGILLEVVI
jgi:hypothetical protein